MLFAAGSAGSLSHYFRHGLKRCAKRIAIVFVAGMVGFLSPVLTYAGEADVLKAVATQTGEHYRFDVTIRSNDKGWDYYCDRFEILTEDGKVLGTRILYHPHETEQPFTRSLGQVSIPAGIRSVRVRASMKPGGESGDTVSIALPGR